MGYQRFSSSATIPRGRVYPTVMDGFNMNDPVNDPTLLKTHSIVPGLRQNRNRENEKVGWREHNSGPIVLSGSVDETNSITLPPLQRSVTDLGTLRTMYKRPKSPTPNYTMINRRAPRTPLSADFKALNIKSRPIPSLYDKPVDEKEFVKKDMKIWKDEVKKVVPSRPPIALASDWEAPPAEWDDRDQYIYGAKPVFYKNLKYTPHKDFIVNPEWLSEFMKVSTYSPAYRTCALRYGWCA